MDGKFRGDKCSYSGHHGYPSTAIEADNFTLYVRDPTQDNVSP